MDIAAVKTSYRYWAPVYNYTFGAVSRMGRRKVADYINSRSGSLLEVGVGTGMALDIYGDHLEITGIDVSPEMLDKARKKVAAKGMTHVRQIAEMDARTLAFPDDHFDTVVAMYVISVVPEPERVMAEMARVCKPGGEVLIVGHFARDRGALAFFERLFAPLAHIIGWHSDFEMRRVIGAPGLSVVSAKPMAPFGIFTFLKQRKG